MRARVIKEQIFQLYTVVHYQFKGIKVWSIRQIAFVFLIWNS
jgi:hypothetical protein